MAAPFQVGDIVSHHGIWVISRARPDLLPHGDRWEILREFVDARGAKQRTSHLCSTGDLALVTRPTFIAGAALTSNGADVIVVADDGALVRVALKTDRAFVGNDGHRVALGGSLINAEKANLVLDNIHTLIGGNDNG